MSVVDWSQCLVDNGCRDKPVFIDDDVDDDSTHGMCLRSRNKEIPKARCSLGKDLSSSDEDLNSSHEGLYSFDKQETCQDAYVIGKSKKKKCKSRKPKEEQRQKGATKIPVKWPEMNNDINFSDIEQHSLIISNSPLIEGCLEPVESPDPVETKDNCRLVLDPVPVLCSTPQVDLRGNGRSARDRFSENLSDVSSRTLPLSTIDFSYRSEKSSFCKDSYKASHGYHGDCSLGDTSARLSMQHNASSGGICDSSLTPGIMKTSEKQFSHRLVMDSSMDMFSLVKSRAEESVFDRSDADESISKMELSLSTHDIHNTSKEVFACSADPAVDETLNETEDSKYLSHCLSRIMEEEDDAIGNGSEDDGGSESKDEGGSESEDEGDNESEDEGGNESEEGEGPTTSVMSSGEGDVIGSQNCDISIDKHDRSCVHESSEHNILHDQIVTPAATRVHDVQSVGGGEGGFVTPPSKMLLPLQEALQKSARNMKEMLTPLRLHCLDRVPTFEEKVLFLCEQTRPCHFSSVLPDRLLKGCSKIGEGVYGEVFRIQQKGEYLAVKIIPIEGTRLVNGEKQKTFEEILPEVIIAKELSLLRDSTTNRTENFVRLKSVSLVRGHYPKSLLRQWDKYDSEVKSENDRPGMFDATQLFIIFAFEESGKSLENFEWSNLDEVRSIMSQVAFSLAVAERSLEFEHRDLHWGNVLIRSSDQTTLDYCLDGQTKTVSTSGLHVTIIDFTLSRLRKDGCTIFTDLSLDNTLFEGEGEYQFEIYRLMKKENFNNWGPHHPYSNVLWIHYLLDKLVTSRTVKGSRNTKRELRTLMTEILNYKSAEDLISRCQYFMSQ